jgi:8-oxo-dGTP diphosphatase
MPEEGKHYVTLFIVCVREERKEPRVLEKDKCEGWEWAAWEDLRGWVASKERRLFLPLVNLVAQRPGVIPTIV